MKNSKENLKVALVTESLWHMGGANRVLEVFAKIYPKADIFALFGDNSSLSDGIAKHKITYSQLNNRLFIKSLYRYTYNLWPLMMEKFNFDGYDLVISSSASVAMGVVTPITCKHVAYVHSPMRYLWDLKVLGTDKLNRLKQNIVNFCLVFMRIWEVSASARSSIMIANSNFVAKRISKYWKRDVDAVLTPPIHYYDGEIVNKREDYIVAGAPFEPNKRGDFLLECASKLKIQLKLIGTGSMESKLRHKYRNYKNIQFLGKISEEEKWNILAHASCFVMPGIEDYGIFPVEAMSAGTPVLAYASGGILENLKEGVSGYYFNQWSLDNFDTNLKKVLGKKWNYGNIAESVRRNNNTEEEFRTKFLQIMGNLS